VRERVYNFYVLHGIALFPIGNGNSVVFNESI